MIMEDEKQIPNFRCDRCAVCMECKMSVRMRSMSRREKLEQEAIKSSVRVQYDTQETFVDLPFMKNPEEYLLNAFKGPDNLESANAVYLQQCKKPETMKQGMRKE